VFVQDGDVVQRLQDLSRDAPFTVRAKNWGYSRLFACSVRRAVARADLALLKGKAVHDRYGQSARNAKDFHDTSYGLKDVIPSSAVDAKCAALARSGRLKCLVLGRLVDIKCVDHAIRAVSLATRSGARLELDIIGDGPDESRLRALACQLGVESTVRFLGSRQYGPDLLRTVAEYHVMLFTALAEETPRALFDGLAGGCALLAYESTYTRQVIGEIGHGRCVAKGDERALASLLRNVDVDRAQPEAWIRRAAAAAFYHAAESWYRRRAEWTIEAHLRRTGGR
jgi:glycosyltransferase involved in cell wall biosynthesis